MPAFGCAYNQSENEWWFQNIFPYSKNDGECRCSWKHQRASGRDEYRDREDRSDRIIAAVEASVGEEFPKDCP